MSWTSREIEYLRENASSGAGALADELGKTVCAVKTMASRLGVSLRRLWHCPRCGTTVDHPLDRSTGWCRACAIEESRERAAAENRRLAALVRDEEARIERASRERQAIYSNTSYKRRKLRNMEKK